MKPIKLEMSGFGPYGEKTEINFEALGEKGLFLITGDTGAGKTTVFDAIAFALFNRTSGNLREIDSLRSDYAASDTETYVRFTFSHQGRRYEVYRSPQYLREKKKGRGTTLRPAKAVLYREPDAPAEGTKQVNEAVETILRITYDQFKQISMIAQGEFREVLNADTKKRSEILQKIFATGGYNRMGILMEERYRKAETEMKELYRSMTQFFDGVQCDENSGLRERLGQEKAGTGQESPHRLHEKKTLLQEILEEDEGKLALAESEYDFSRKVSGEKEKAYHLIQSDNECFAELDQVTRRYRDLCSRQEEMAERQNRLNRGQAALYRVNPAYQTFREAEKESALAEQELTACRDRLGTLREEQKKAEALGKKWADRRPEAEEKQKQAEKIGNEKKAYREREELTAALEKEQRKRKKLSEDRFLAAESIGEMKNLMEKEREEREELSEVPEQQIKKAGERELLQKEKENLQSLQSRIKEDILPLQQAVEEAQERYLKERLDYERCVEGYRQAERALEENYAGILADRLQRGEPCPVCGATVHPAPAALPPSHINEEEVERRREDSLQAEKRKNEANQEAATLLASFEAQKNFLKEEACRRGFPSGDDFLAFDKALSVKIGVTEERIAQAEVECRALAAKRERLEELQKREKKHEQCLQQLSEEEKKIGEGLMEVFRRCSVLEGQQKSLCELAYPSFEAAEKAEQELRREAEEILKQWERAEQYRNSLSNEIAAEAGKAEAAERRKEAGQRAAGEKKTIWIETLQREGFSDEEEFKGARLSKEEIDREEAKLGDYREQQAITQSRLEIARERTEGKVRKDGETARQEAITAGEALQAAQKALTMLQHRIEDNRRIMKRLDKGVQQAEKMLEKVTLLQNLTHLLRGNVTAKNRTSFETYVQMEGFDGIIRAANRRLYPISGGQFQLCRHEDPEAKKNMALNLDIFDNYTGKKRPVSTLSGGESFMASLSLALGLSDHVTASAGGIQIDTVFIDEGFGTLDEKSLHGAVELLDSLSGSNKLIGIISHREELKQVIRKKISITKTGKGSRVTVDGGL